MAKEKEKPEKKPKEPKKRADKYDSKLAINGTFEDVIKASFLGKPKEKITNIKVLSSDKC